MLIVFIRAIILYGLLILGIRLMGKGQIGELQPSELVTTVLLSNIATLPVEDASIPMVIGIIPIFTLVSIDIIMSYVSLHSRKLRQLVCGSAKIVISQGRIDQKQLLRLRFSADDLLESLRGMNIFDISEVQLAVVETNGKLSVYQKKPSRNVTNEDMGNTDDDGKDPPIMVIENGCVIDNALETLSLDKQAFIKEIKKRGTQPANVYICTADADGIVDLIEKEGKV